jgi:Ni/Fe-hydrogenase 1 B-type cytochrome subunit
MGSQDRKIKVRKTNNHFMTTNQVKSDNRSSYFIQEHSVMIRIWHWLTFGIISAIIITVLLNSTLFNQRRNIPMVQDQLKAKGIIVSEDQSFAVTREYEDKLWGIHKLLGYGLAFLLFSRVIIELTQPGEEKISSRIKKALGLLRKKDGDWKEYRHYLLVKYSYLLLYILLFCMAVTGLGLAFGRELGFSRGLHGIIKEIHSFGQYLMYAFVIIHLCGVIIADITKNRGLVSGMINGNK